MENQRELIAWAAGFIDGEGVVCIQKGRPSKNGVSPRYTLLVQVGCTQLAPLLRLRLLFSGSISPHGYRSKNKKSKPSFTWSISAIKAVSCVRQVLPYLSIKTEQTHLGLELEHLKTVRVHSKKVALTASELEAREVIYQKVKVLNERGIPKRTLQLQLEKRRGLQLEF